MREAYKEAHPQAIIQVKMKLAAKKVRAKSKQGRLNFGKAV